MGYPISIGVTQLVEGLLLCCHSEGECLPESDAKVQESRVERCRKSLEVTI